MKLWAWSGPTFDEKVPRYVVIDCPVSGPLLWGGPRRARIQVETARQARFLAGAMNRYYKPRPVGEPVSPTDWEGVKWVFRQEFGKR